MIGSKILFLCASFAPPSDFSLKCIGYYERIQYDCWITKSLFNVFYRLVEVDFWVIKSMYSSQPLWIDKTHILHVTVDNPKNKVRIKVPRLEETHTLPFALVPKQKQLFVFKDTR